MDRMPTVSLRLSTTSARENTTQGFPIRTPQKPGQKEFYLHRHNRRNHLLETLISLRKLPVLTQEYEVGCEAIRPN